MLNGVVGRVFPGNVAERKADKSTSDRDGDCKPPTLWLRLVRIDVMTGPADRVDSNNVFCHAITREAPFRDPTSTGHQFIAG
jgi:hypothetical protein